MKKYLKIAVLAATLVSLTACGAPNSLSESGTESNVQSVTNVSEPVIEQHEDVAPLTYSEDEAVANLYYKRSADDEGNSVFEVVRASDGETVLLPVNQTVLYISEADDHYYEVETLSYDLDGESVSAVQYALHVQGINP